MAGSRGGRRRKQMKACKGTSCAKSLVPLGESRFNVPKSFNLRSHHRAVAIKEGGKTGELARVLRTGDEMDEPIWIQDGRIMCERVGRRDAAPLGMPRAWRAIDTLPNKFRSRSMHL